MDYLTYLYPRGAIAVKSAGNDGMWHNAYIDHDDYGWALYNGALHAEGTVRAASALSHRYNRLPHPEMFGIRAEYSDFWIRSNKPVRVTVKTGVKTYTFDTGNWGQFDDAYSTHNYYDMDLMSEFNGEYCGYLGFNDWKADRGLGRRRLDH